MKFVYTLLNTYNYTKVGILCDDAQDILTVYQPLCGGLFDTLRLSYNVSAARFYVNASDRSSLKHYQQTAKPGDRRNGKNPATRGGHLVSVTGQKEASFSTQEYHDFG